jgi:hypothetical protein
MRGYTPKEVCVFTTRAEMMMRLYKEVWPGQRDQPYMAFKPIDSPCSRRYTTNEPTAAFPPVSTSLVPKTTGSENSDRWFRQSVRIPGHSLDHAHGRGSAMTLAVVKDVLIKTRLPVYPTGRAFLGFFPACLGVQKFLPCLQLQNHC